MMEAKDRKRALEAIGLMLAGFPSSQSSITEATADAYLAAVSHCSIDGVVAACGAFLQGRVETHDNAFPPTAPRLAALAFALGEAARRLSEAPSLVSYPIGGEPPKGYVALGGRDDTWRSPFRRKQIAQQK